MSNSTPLDITLDLSGVKTQIPLIVDGHTGRVRFTNIEQVPGDKGNTLKFTFHLLEPAPTTEGLMIQPGFTIFERVQLYSKEGSQRPQWFLEKLSKIIDGFLGTGDLNNSKGKPPRPTFDASCVAMLLGKESFAKFKVKTGEFTGNEITSYTFPGDFTA